MKLAAARAVEMTVAAKPCGFRPHLGNRCAIPTFPPPRRLLDCFLNSNPERSFPQPSAQASFRLILRLEKTVRTHSEPWYSAVIHVSTSSRVPTGRIAQVLPVRQASHFMPSIPRVSPRAGAPDRNGVVKGVDV